MFFNCFFCCGEHRSLSSPTVFPPTRVAPRQHPAGIQPSQKSVLKFEIKMVFETSAAQKFILTGFGQILDPILARLHLIGELNLIFFNCFFVAENIVHYLLQLFSR